MSSGADSVKVSESSSLSLTRSYSAVEVQLAGLLERCHPMTESPVFACALSGHFPRVPEWSYEIAAQWPRRRRRAKHGRRDCSETLDWRLVQRME